MFLTKIKNYLLLLLLFVLPWQTRLIYLTGGLNMYQWEYGSLSLYATELLLSVIILLTLIEKFRNKDFTNHLKNLNYTRLIGVVFGLFLFFSVYLRFASFYREVTWQYLNWIIYGFCLTTIIIESQLNFRKLSLAVWVGSLLPAGLAIYQFFSQSVFANKWLGIAIHRPDQLGAAVLEFTDGRYLRAYGSFGWPNALGIYLAAVFVLGVILILSLRAKGEAIPRDSSCDVGMTIHSLRSFKIPLLLIGQIIILSALFFSFARGAWLALVLSLIVLIFKNYRQKNLWPQFVFYILTLCILLAIFKPLVFSRFNFNNRLETRSISERVEQWQDFKIVFSQNKFLGVGPGVYTYALFYYKLDHGHSFEPIHNIYLLFLGEWGIVGVFLLVYLLFFIRKKINWFFPPLLVILFAGFFDHWSLSMFTGIIFLGLMVGLSIKSEI